MKATIESPGVVCQMREDGTGTEITVFTHYYEMESEVCTFPSGTHQLTLNLREVGCRIRAIMSEEQVRDVIAKLAAALPKQEPSELPASSQFILGMADALMAGGAKGDRR
jgi:hypothetical protein